MEGCISWVLKTEIKKDGEKKISPLSNFISLPHYLTFYFYAFIMNSH